MKITDRDRELLKWLAYFVAILLLWNFVFKTMNEKLIGLEAERDILIQEKLIVEQTLPKYDEFKKIRKDTQLLVLDQFNQFVDVYASEEFEALILPLLLENNADIQYYQASPLLIVNPETLSHPQEVFNYKLKTLIDEFNQAVAVEPVTTMGSELFKTTVQYTLGMSYADYLNLVDALRDLKLSIILTKSDYQFEDNLASISLDVYSMHKLDFDQE